VERTVEILKTVRAAGGTVWLAGNGGSAATASHFANDLTKMAKVKALAISDFTATTLAYGNDDGWEQMFANALQVHIGLKDAVLGISCSGNSKNIISFLSAARTRFKIGFTGPDQSLMSKMGVDVLVRAMANEITVQEDVHSIVCHAIAGALRDA
jgi:D-sedoheptulose 7-phosphate isomerase